MEAGVLEAEVHVGAGGCVMEAGVLEAQVHVGAGGCVKVAGVLLDLKFMWELAAVKRELAAM